MNKLFRSCHARVILCKIGEIHILEQRLYISALEQARVLIIGRYVVLKVMNTFYKHYHALVIL